MELSYCVVNTSGRDYLLNCLESIRRTVPADTEHEVLVLDNASDDGSAQAVAERFAEIRVIARDRRAGLAENNSLLLREARGRFCLLLNEDSEVLDGCAQELLSALLADDDAAVAGAQLLDPEGNSIPCAWRFPSLATVVAQALLLHRRLVTESGGQSTREVDWVQSCTMLVRREAAEEVHYLDPDFFVYSEEVDFQKRMRDAGWRVLHVPAARAIHHEQLASDLSGSGRRVVQFHRGRDLYMRKHHSVITVLLSRLLWAWSYVPRAIAASFMRDHESRRYWLHARQALRPSRGDGLREAADAYNRRAVGERAGERVAGAPSPGTAAP